MTSDEPTYPQEDGEDGADLAPETLRLLKNGDNEFDAEIDAAADAWQLLIDAVNESDEPCLPECDSIAHAEGCPHIDRAAWMAKQQATIVDLRKRLEAADRLAEAVRRGECAPSVLQRLLDEYAALAGKEKP